MLKWRSFSVGAASGRPDTAEVSHNRSGFLGSFIAVMSRWHVPSLPHSETPFTRKGWERDSSVNCQSNPEFSLVSDNNRTIYWWSRSPQLAFLLLATLMYLIHICCQKFPSVTSMCSAALGNLNPKLNCGRKRNVCHIVSLQNISVCTGSKIKHLI